MDVARNTPILVRGSIAALTLSLLKITLFPVVRCSRTLITVVWMFVKVEMVDISVEILGAWTRLAILRLPITIRTVLALGPMATLTFVVSVMTLPLLANLR